MATETTFTCDSCGTTGELRKVESRRRRRILGLHPPKWERVYFHEQSFDLCPSCIAQVIAWIKKSAGE